MPNQEKDCFVIMQIGNKDMERIWSNVYKPAIQSCGLNPIRVDKHDDGSLVKQQIVRYLNQAEVIIGDLTNERPNCYLEIGYVMGLGRHDKLILCCRSDHNPDSPIYVPGKGKIHFDLQGYHILWWESGDFEKFKAELVDRIGRRKGRPRSASQYERIVAVTTEQTTAWLEKVRREAFGQ